MQPERKPDPFADQPATAPSGVDADLAARVAALNARYRHHGATSVLEQALKDPDAGKLALVSSFGAESVVLLHLMSIINRHTPVIFIDTQMLFAETLAYQAELAERLALEDMRIIRA
ncbi:MAG: phosphoadenosine phosphosulfate reductase family protein, partial [Pseudomonadota bacterium]|nr:phosphoadenosine phosphosulfate reductase family protein [Pseudomonadota bacterium]